MEPWQREYLAEMGNHLTVTQKEILQNGAKSLAQAWILQAMYQQWQRQQANRPSINN